MDYIIDFRRCIGKGGYGFVFEALRRVNSNDHTKSRLISYCAKVFRNKIAFDSELQVLEHLSNEGISNIVQFVDAVQSLFFVSACSNSRASLHHLGMLITFRAVTAQSTNSLLILSLFSAKRMSP